MTDKTSKPAAKPSASSPPANKSNRAEAEAQREPLIDDLPHKEKVTPPEGQLFPNINPAVGKMERYEAKDDNDD